MNISLYKVSTRFLYLYLFFLFGAAAVVLIENTVEDRSNILYSFFWILLHIISLILFFITIRTQNLKRGLVFLLLICTYILISVSWSPNFKISFIYGGMLCLNLIFAYVIVHYISIKLFMTSILYMLVFLISISFIFNIIDFNGVKYLDHHNRLTILGTDPLRGFFAHKIMASLYANIGIIFAQVLISSYKRHFISLIFIIFILYTGSSTGIALIGISIFVSYLINLFIKYRLTFSIFNTITIILILLISFTLAFVLPIILENLGRDMTLTGRTLLWDWGIRAWSESPLFGWGFRGYFDSTSYDQIHRLFASFSNYEVPHFHNSLIQTAVDFGIIGVIFLLSMIFYSIFALYNNSLNNHCKYSQLGLVSLVIFLIASITMHLFLNYNHFVTFFIAVLFFYSLNLNHKYIDENDKSLY